MELRHLRYFVTVVQEKQFSRAAEKLHMVQPALSMQIKDLEEELGVTLLQRTTRHLELTAAGSLFYDEALRTLAQAERAASLARRAGRGLIGSLRVGYVGNAILSGILPKKLQVYRESYPDVEIVLQEIPLLRQVKAIVENQLDVCLAPSFQNEAPEEVSTRRLACWPWILAMAENHPLAKYSSLTPSLLREEEFILYADPKSENGHGSVLDRLLGRRPKVVHKSANAFTVVALAAAGYGVTLLPGSYLSVYIPRLVYRLIRNFTERSDITLYYKKDEDRPVVKAFISSAKEEAID